MSGSSAVPPSTTSVHSPRGATVALAGGQLLQSEPRTCYLVQLGQLAREGSRGDRRRARRRESEEAWRRSDPALRRRSVVAVPTSFRRVPNKVRARALVTRRKPKENKAFRRVIRKPTSAARHGRLDPARPRPWAPIADRAPNHALARIRESPASRPSLITATALNPGRAPPSARRVRSASLPSKYDTTRRAGFTGPVASACVSSVLPEPGVLGRDEVGLAQHARAAAQRQIPQRFPIGVPTTNWCS